MQGACIAETCPFPISIMRSTYYLVSLRWRTTQRHRFFIWICEHPWFAEMFRVLSFIWKQVQYCWYITMYAHHEVRNSVPHTYHVVSSRRSFLVHVDTQNWLIFDHFHSFRPFTSPHIHKNCVVSLLFILALSGTATLGDLHGMWYSGTGTAAVLRLLVERDEVNWWKS